MKSEAPAQGYGREIEALRRARRVHIATVRKDGSQSKSVPVWFTLTDDSNSILIQTPRGSWTARRVRGGSAVIVWIGSRTGSAIIGDAEISGDPKLTKRIVDDYPRKYLLARIGFHRPRQDRFDSGQIVAIKITPRGSLPSGFASRPGSPAPNIGEGNAPAAPASPRPESMARAQAANLLSASRFVLAAMWIAAFASGMRGPGILGAIATAAAVSDYADGPIARWMGHAEGAGRWLDPVADIVFVLTALTSEALAGAIPIYIPILIACSFGQYTIDSVAIGGSSEPIKSRLGHWGGIINFALVIVLAWTPAPMWPGRLVRQVSPLIAAFYVAAMIERALSYRLVQGMRRQSRQA
jgi:phosphatidylglycerophosphate synthase